MPLTLNPSFLLRNQPQQTVANIHSILLQLSAQAADAIESETLEIKGWCKSAKELADKATESVACLANARGGIVIVGIEDHVDEASKYSKCPHPDVNPEWLQRRLQDLTLPPVDCNVFDISEAIPNGAPFGSNAIAIHIPKSRVMGGHLTAKGVSKKRIGKECHPQYSAEDDRTKVILQGASMSDLSAASIEWASARHRRQFRAGSPEGDPSELLRTARLITDEAACGSPSPQLTLAALLLFGNEGALRRHVPYFETSITTQAGRTTLKSNIVDSVRQLCIGQNAILSGLLPSLDTKILTELVVNSYVHRCYRTASPILISLTDSELEIENPGELAGGLSPDSLIHCIPVYRNLLLAETARFFVLCDKVGLGIDIVFRGVLQGGLPIPEFESEHGKFSARLSLQRSSEFREFAKRRSQSLTSLDEIIALRMLWSRDSATITELTRAMQRGKEQGERILSEMTRKLMIEPEGQFYRLSANLRSDIANVFHDDQLTIPNLWGE